MNDFTAPISDLAAIGLTAAFARALGDAGISCNVVAAAHHDHMFVPVERADAAIAALRALQRDGGDGGDEAVFATPRLRGRRLVPADVDALLDVYGDAAAMRWVGDGQPLDSANLASHRVLEKAGMRRGALRRDDGGSHTQLFEWTAETLPA